MYSLIAFFVLNTLIRSLLILCGVTIYGYGFTISIAVICPFTLIGLNSKLKKLEYYSLFNNSFD
jgi:uncharacterized membrane protein